MANAGSAYPPPVAERPMGAVRATAVECAQLMTHIEAQAERIQRSYRNLAMPRTPAGKDEKSVNQVLPNCLETDLQQLHRRLNDLSTQLVSLAEGFEASL